MKDQAKVLRGLARLNGMTLAVLALSVMVALSATAASAAADNRDVSTTGEAMRQLVSEGKGSETAVPTPAAHIVVAQVTEQQEDIFKDVKSCLIIDQASPGISIEAAAAKLRPCISDLVDQKNPKGGFWKKLREGGMIRFNVGVVKVPFMDKRIAIFLEAGNVSATLSLGNALQHALNLRRNKLWGFHVDVQIDLMPGV